MLTRYLHKTDEASDYDQSIEIEKTEQTCHVREN